MQTATRRQDLSAAAARGILWSGSGRVARQLIQLPTFIVLARLLVPDDFGVVGMAMVVIAMGQLFADFGIGSAIVQSRDTDPTSVDSAFWANVAIAGLVAAGLSVSAGWIALFYGDPRVAPVLISLSISLVIAAMVNVPRALLHKAMDFSSDARAQVLGTLAGSIVAVAAAVAGIGVWSLVLQSIVGNLGILLITTWKAAWRPRLVVSWSSLRPLLDFSMGLLGSSLLGLATRNADNVLIGKFLGSGPLGFYSMAYRIMLFPLNQVSDVIVKVLFPTLSTLQREPARYRRAYLLAISSIATMTFPMMLGLHVVLDDFVVVVVGEEWLPMLTILKVFCVLGMIQSIGTTAGAIYTSTGRTRLLFVLNLWFAPAIVGSFVIGLRWGIDGVAVAYAIASSGAIFVSLAVAFRIVGLRMREFHRVLAGPMAATLIMYASVAGFLVFFGAGFESALLRLAVSVPLGVVAYVVASLLVNRRQLLELVSRLRSAVGSA